MAICGDAAGREKAYLLDMLPSEGMRILDVGCGEGRLTRHIAGGSRQVIGIDLPGALPNALDQPLPSRVSLLGASGIHLPFRRCAFDHVIFSLSF